MAEAKGTFVLDVNEEKALEGLRAFQSELEKNRKKYEEVVQSQVKAQEKADREIKASRDKAAREWSAQVDAMGKAAEKSQANWDKLLGGIKKWSIAAVAAIYGVKKAIDESFDLLEATDNFRRMEKSLPHGALKDFTEVTKRTISQIQLMELATKGMSGQFKLSQMEMEKLLAVSIELHNRGMGPAAEIAKKLEDAMIKEASAAKELGIVIKLTGDKVKDNSLLMREFDKILMDPTAMDVAARNHEQLRAKWEDSMMRMREAVIPVAEAILKLVPAIESVTKVLGPLVDLMDKSGQFEFLGVQKEILGIKTKTWNRDIMQSNMREAAREYYRRDVMGKNAQILSGADAILANIKTNGRPMSEVALDVANAEPDADWSGGGTVRRGGAGGGRREPSAWEVRIAQRMEAMRKRPSGGGSLGTAVMFDAGGASFSAEETAAAEALPRQRADAAKQRQKEFWDSQDKEWQGKLADRTSAVGGAFSALSAGIAASVEAAMSGSDNIAKAFGKAAAAALKSIAIEATVRAAFEGGMGLAMAAIGNPQSAVHFAAAGQFALTAAIAGTLGAGLGAISGGGAASAGSRGAGPQVGGGFGGRTQQGGSQTIIVNVNGAGPGANSDFFESAVRRAVSKATPGGSRVISLE